MLITGQHLSSPQSTKLVVYHAGGGDTSIVNASTCITQNDTLITCLTPALSRDMLANVLADSPQQTSNSVVANTAAAEPQQQQRQQSLTSYESGGLRMRFSLLMDDVRSARNLDEYYHHLPHYITYFDDPILHKLSLSSSSHIVEATGDDLVIQGDNLHMRQLDQDVLVTVGPYVCALKSLHLRELVCEPPHKIAPQYDDAGRLVERPLLQVVAAIGNNIRYSLGHMQYSSAQYHQQQQVAAPDATTQMQYARSAAAAADSSASMIVTTASNSDARLSALVLLSLAGFLAGFLFTLLMAVSRLRKSRAEREYKRIQLQMGSLDATSAGAAALHSMLNPSLFAQQQQQQQHFAPMQYLNNATSIGNAGKKPLYQLSQPTNVAPSPLTDISSLTGQTNSPYRQQHQHQQQQHLVKIGPNGNIINSAMAATNLQLNEPKAPATTTTVMHIYDSANSSGCSASASSSASSSSSSSSQVSPAGSTRANNNNNPTMNASNMFTQNNQNGNSSRNFNWTQEAPSTIVPYAVIEACNLKLEGKNAMHGFV